MFPLSQPGLRGVGLGYCRAGSRGEKGGSSRGRWGETDKWRRERAAERETEKSAFQKAIDRLPLKISYWISFTGAAF